MTDEAVEQLTREQRRSRRKREVRARTLQLRNVVREHALGALLYPDRGERLPATRGECEGGPRPCPMVRCRWNLYLDVTPRTGAIKLNFPDLAPEDMAESCALDVADRGGVSLEGVGAIMNLTRERIRQVELDALAKMARRGAELREYSDEGPVGKRRLPVLEVVR